MSLLIQIKEIFLHFSSSLSNQTENPTPKLTKSNQKVLNTNCTMARDLGFSQNISRQKKKKQTLETPTQSSIVHSIQNSKRVVSRNKLRNTRLNKNSPRFNLISNTNASSNQRNRSKITSHHRVIARTRVSKVKIIKKIQRKDPIRLTSRSLVAAPKAFRD